MILRTLRLDRKHRAAIVLVSGFLALAASPAIAQWGGERGGDDIFFKTVGVDSGICAPDSQIGVTAGTRVHYCYSIPVPADQDYTYNLTDDQLGFLDSGLVKVNQTYQFNISSEIFVDTLNLANFSYRAINQTVPSRGELDEGFFLANATVFVNGSGGSGIDTLAVPTLSEVSLFAFGALLILGAAITMRRLGS